MSDSGWRHVLTSEGEGRYVNLDRVDMIVPKDKRFGSVLVFGSGEDDFLTVLDDADDILRGNCVIQELREYYTRKEEEDAPEAG